MSDCRERSIKPPAWLRKGIFALELAPDQAPIVADWLCEAGLGDVVTHRDLAADPRVVSARGPQPPTSEIG